MVTSAQVTQCAYLPMVSLHSTIPQVAATCKEARQCKNKGREEEEEEDRKQIDVNANDPHEPAL